MPNTVDTIDVWCKRFFGTFAFLQLCVGPIPSISIFFATDYSAETIGILVPGAWMLIPGVFGLTCSSCMSLPFLTNTPQRNFLTRKIIKYLKVFITMFGITVVLLVLSIIISGTALGVELPRIFVPHALSGGYQANDATITIICLIYSIVVFFVEIGLLFCLKKLLQKYREEEWKRETLRPVGANDAGGDGGIEVLLPGDAPPRDPPPSYWDSVKIRTLNAAPTTSSRNESDNDADDASGVVYLSAKPETNLTCNIF